ncbi:MAG: hypothetical protein M3470_06640 [Chloroflexota bacterium]|nr:hypothetical protein [Chloroflexota bacterium]
MIKPIALVLVIAACGGGAKPPTAASYDKMGKMDTMIVEGGGMGADEASKFAPLEVGADWQSYTKLNKASFKSETHGGRLVDTYVNSIGLDAFKAGTDMPVGSILVKTSKDEDDGTNGPVFVMEKRAAGFNLDERLPGVGSGRCRQGYPACTRRAQR